MPGFGSELRLNGVDNLGRADTASHTHHSASVTATCSGAYTGAMTRAEAATEAVTESGTASTALRRQNDLRRIGCPEMSGSVGLGNLDLHRRFNRQLRILNPGELRWKQLYLCHLRRLAFGRLDDFVRPAASASALNFSYGHNLWRWRRGVKSEIEMGDSCHWLDDRFWSLEP